MTTYIVWNKESEYLVNSESPIRAIQSVISITDTFACDWNISRLDDYSFKAQAKIRSNAITL